MERDEGFGKHFSNDDNPAHPEWLMCRIEGAFFQHVVSSFWNIES